MTMIYSRRSLIFKSFPCSLCTIITILILVFAFSTEAFTQERDQRTLNHVSKSVTLSQDSYTTDEIADALGIDRELVRSVDFLGSDPRGYTVFSEIASDFPINGQQFVALSTGCVDLALDVDNTSNVISCVLDQGPTGPGNATDIVRMQLELNVPENANYLSFYFKFFSEEYPDFIGSAYNDGFVVELGKSTFTVEGSNLIAPDNQVFDEFGNHITINELGVLGQNAEWAAGTIYGRDNNGGATNVINTIIPLPSVTPETITIIFSIFDVQDRVFDSTVFIDNLQFITQENEFQLVAMEVNQSIQNWRNDVPLIQHKPAVLRAHLQHKHPTESARPHVRLEASRNGVPLPDSPRTPVQSDPVAPPLIDPSEDMDRTLAMRRSDWDNSVNFALPSEWLHGTVDLTLTGNNIDCHNAPGVTATGNGCRLSVDFEPAGEPQITFLLISWSNKDGETYPAPLYEEVRENIRRTGAILPIADISSISGGKSIHLEFPKLESGQYPSDDDIIEELELAWKGSVSEAFNLGTDHIYYGFIHADSAEGTVGGKVNEIPGNVGYTNINRYTPSTTAHEFGHIFGRHHAVTESVSFLSSFWEFIIDRKTGQCREFASKTAPDFPYVIDINDITLFNSAWSGITGLGPLDQGADMEMWGVNTLSNRVAGAPGRNLQTIPWHGVWGEGSDGFNAELMSYCTFTDYFKTSYVDDRWISDFTYIGILDHLNERFGVTSKQLLADASGSVTANRAEIHASSESEPYVIVRGRIDISQESPENSVRFLPTGLIFTLPHIAEQLMPDDGDFTLKIYNDQDEVVFETGFEPRLDSKSDFTTASFSIPTPSNPNTGRVEILYEGTVIGSMEPSPNPPVIEFDSFNEKTVQNNELFFSWSGSDPDGNDLTYSVQYSSDGGNSWETIATGLSRNSLTVPVDNLRGTEEGLIRIMASDGYNTAYAVSPQTFSVPNSPPVVTISTPGDGVRVDSSAIIVLRGSAFDLEDGQLSGTALVWQSDQHGMLGTGRVLDLKASALSRGTHTITLTATDSGGAIDQTSVSVEVTAPTARSEQSDKPRIMDFIPDLKLDPGDETIQGNLNSIFNNPMDSEMTFKVETSDDKVAEVTIDGNMLNVRPLSIGLSRVTVTAINDDGETRMTFIVTVGDVTGVQFVQPEGWRMTSIPVKNSEVLDSIAYNAFYPDALQMPFHYDREQGYYLTEFMKPGRGYWLKFDSAQPFEFYGLELEEKEVELQEGWNMIGALSTPANVSDILSDPENIIVSGPFNTEYAFAESFQPGSGYWVLADRKGVVALSSASKEKMAGTLASQVVDAGKMMNSPEHARDAFHRLEISPKGSHGKHILYFGGSLHELDQRAFKVPPLPPGRQFDARFEGNSRLTELHQGKINLQSRHWPLMISLHENDLAYRGYKYFIEVHEGSEMVHRMELTNDVTVQLHEVDDKYDIYLTFMEDMVPAEYVLKQNYPNPFNPATQIEFHLAESGSTSLQVFDIQGRRVATLVDGELDAGIHSISFDTAQLQLASGVYIYRLSSNGITKVRKMTLIK